MLIGSRRMKRILQLMMPGLALVAGGLLAGCRGLPVAGEKAARQEVAEVGRQLPEQLPELAGLGSESEAVDQS